MVNRSTDLMGDHHWADETATRIINMRENQKIYTLAAGITPSGTVHIGNFREVMTVELVQRALERKGKNTRFIFSWDDFDVFRKVPKNVPSDFKQYLWQSITTVPDPSGEESSYARHHEAQFEKSLSKVGLFPEFIYQSKKYQNRDYIEGIKTAIEKRDVIKNILNVHRQTPLDLNWSPVSVFCSSCGSNQTQISKQSVDEMIYHCQGCDFQETISIDSANHIKLLWRIDWPMRWAYEKVDFEPGGKDHSSDGGSYDTGKKIVQDVYDYKAPIYIPYNFVSIKGKGGKISSSSGDVITLDDVLEIYTPEIVRWIFASYRNNVEFSISFDIDVIKNYEAYDRLERVYYGLEEVSEKQIQKARRIFELSQIDPDISKISTDMPFRESFRHLTNVIQIYHFDLEKVLDKYRDRFHHDWEREQFKIRCLCATNWIKKYAPDEFIFQLNTSKSPLFFDEYDVKYQKAFEKFSFFVKSEFSHSEEAEITEFICSLIEEFQLEAKYFYEILYRLLIGKKKGPRLVNFLKTIEYEQLLKLL